MFKTIIAIVGKERVRGKNIVKFKPVKYSHNPL